MRTPRRVLRAQRQQRQDARGRLWQRILAVAPDVANRLTPAQVQALVWAENSWYPSKVYFQAHPEKIEARERVIGIFDGFAAETFDALVAKGLAERFGTENLRLTAQGRRWAQ